MVGDATSVRSGADVVVVDATGCSRCAGRAGRARLRSHGRRSQGRRRRRRRGRGSVVPPAPAVVVGGAVVPAAAVVVAAAGANVAAAAGVVDAGIVDAGLSSLALLLPAPPFPQQRCRGLAIVAGVVVVTGVAVMVAGAVGDAGAEVVVAAGAVPVMAVMVWPTVVERVSLAPAKARTALEVAVASAGRRTQASRGGGGTVAAGDKVGPGVRTRGCLPPSGRRRACAHRRRRWVVNKRERRWCRPPPGTAGPGHCPLPPVPRWLRWRRSLVPVATPGLVPAGSRWPSRPDLSSCPEPGSPARRRAAGLPPCSWPPGRRGRRWRPGRWPK